MSIIHRVLWMPLLIAPLFMPSQPVHAENANLLKLPDAPLTRIHARTSEPIRTLPDGREAYGGLLVRELVRQAVLIAAREEMGLPTRDSSLEDKIGSKDPNALEIQTTCDPTGKVLVTLKLGQKWQSNWSYEETIPFTPDNDLINYRELADKLEHLSRTSFPRALETAKFAKQPFSQDKDSSPVDASIYDSIQRLSPLSQLTAIRKLHFHLPKNGESPERLESLAKAYAHLSMLTQRYLGVQTVAFAARALLYASRLSASFPESTRGIWTQAYVLGMIGSDGSALLTMEEAEKETVKRNEVLPDWKVPLECKCRYDYQAMNKWRDERTDTNEIDDYLYFQCTGGGEWFRCTPSIVMARHFVQKHHAGCTPITRLLAASTSINDQEDIFRRLEPFLQDEIVSVIGKWDDVPGLVKRALATDNPVKFVPKAFVNIAAAIDSSEPSSRSIGRLILEYQILSAYDRFSYLGKTIKADYSKERERFGNEVQDHPLSSVALLGAIHEGTSHSYLRQYFSKLPVDEPRISDVIFLRSLIGVKVDNRDIGQELLEKARWHMDDLSLDYLLASRLLKEDEKRALTERWIRISPYRPAANFILQYPGDSVATEHNPSWVSNAESHPETLHPLVDWLLQHGADEVAIPVLKNAISHTPDPYFYHALATIRKRNNEIEEWRETLEELLKQPEHDTRHASAQCDIAEYYFELNQFDAALPYAMAATRFNTPRALRCAAYCHEGLGHHDEAVELFEKMTKRQPQWGMEWYLACVRLNSNKRDAAKAFVRKIHSGYKDGQYSIVDESDAMIAFCEGHPETAAGHLEKSFRLVPKAYFGLLAALTYEEIGKPTESKRMLQETIAKSQSWSSSHDACIRIANLIRDDHNDARDDRFSQENINELLSNVDPAEKLDCIYLVAIHLDQSGRKEQANLYFKEISDKFYYHRFVSTLAHERLQRSTKVDQ